TDGTQAWYQTIGTDTIPKFKGKTVFYSEAASPQYFNAVLGDVSSSDTIDKVDGALVLRYISGIGTLNGKQLAVADVNGDGTVDMLDAVKILGLV
ncbi:MAG: dockerin type I repeat-containing protein, partial [Lachnospirales bacterium]